MSVAGVEEKNTAIRLIFRLATQTRLILHEVRVKYCSKNAWLSNAQVSDRYSTSCFTTVTYWSRFSNLKYRWKEYNTDIILSKRNIVVLLPPPCALTALWESGRDKTHKMDSLSEWGTFSREHSEDWSSCGCTGSSVFVGHSWLFGFCFDLALMCFFFFFFFFFFILMILRPSQHYYIFNEPFLWRPWEGMLNHLNECKEKKRRKKIIVCVCSGLTSFWTIFQSYHDGVWMRQGAQCSLL